VKYKSIIVVTYGRSGSTLLQGILNTIPNCLIRGENDHFIFSLFKSYQSLQNAKSKEPFNDPNYNTPRHSWYGASQLDLDLFIQTQKEMIKRLLVGEEHVACYGFKEIRYFETMDQLEPFLEFLELVMEDVAIVFNIRNSFDVSQSDWWRKQKRGNMMRRIEHANTTFKDLSATKENAFCFDYDKLMQNDRIVKELFAFLEVPYDQEGVKKILQLDHSQKNNTEAILLPKRSLGYRHIPKVACTSIKTMLYELRMGKSFSRERMGMDVHQYFFKEYRDISKAEFRFIVVRDPIKRLLSAYSNRVVHHKELSKEYLSKQEDLKKIFEEENIPFNPSLSEFIRHFSFYQKVPSIHHHTKPVVMFGIRNLSFYTHVYTIEQLHLLEEDLSQRYKKQMKLPRLQTGGLKLKVAQLSREEITFLLDFYTRDYELLADYYTKERILKEWEDGE
jgi:hypothetical protein